MKWVQDGGQVNFRYFEPQYVLIVTHHQAK